MDVRVGLVVLLVLAGNLMCDARHLVPRYSGSKNVDGVIDVCTMCEEYTTIARDYLRQNKTQDEVMEALHKACLQLHGLSQQCTTLVNYYAPLFFLEVSEVQPERFCKKVALCRDNVVSSPLQKRDTCDFCHKAVDEALEKLKDPDTKLQVIQMLLKACDAMGSYIKKCKSMVFEFGPVILVDAEKFIENADLCTTFHACSMQSVNTQQESLNGNIEMVTSS
ncbi:Prosaposin [Bienertia sinuspersici]